MSQSFLFFFSKISEWNFPWIIEKFVLWISRDTSRNSSMNSWRNSPSISSKIPPEFLSEIFLTIPSQISQSSTQENHYLTSSKVPSWMFFSEIQQVMLSQNDRRIPSVVFHQNFFFYFYFPLLISILPKNVVINSSGIAPKIFSKKKFHVLCQEIFHKFPQKRSLEIRTEIPLKDHRRIDPRRDINRSSSICFSK